MVWRLAGREGGEGDVAAASWGAGEEVTGDGEGGIVERGGHVGHICCHCER